MQYNIFFAFDPFVQFALYLLHMYVTRDALRANLSQRFLCRLLLSQTAKRIIFPDRIIDPPSERMYSTWIKGHSQLSEKFSQCLGSRPASPRRVHFLENAFSYRACPLRMAIPPERPRQVDRLRYSFADGAHADLLTFSITGSTWNGCMRYKPRSH